MTTNQNDTNLLTDEQLETVAAGSGYVKIDVGPIVEPRLGFVDVCDAGTALKRLGFVDVCDAGTALKRRGFVSHGCRGKF